MQKDLTRRSVEAALSRFAADPSTSLQASDIGRVAGDIEKAIAEIDAGKPLWRSRTFWGLAVAAVASVVKPFVGELPVDAVQIADALTSAGQLVGLGLAAYGRLTASRPIKMKA